MTNLESDTDTKTTARAHSEREETAPHSSSPGVVIRKPYDPSWRVLTSFHKNTRTKGQFQAECDINTLMKKYEATGTLEHVRATPGGYGDFSEVTDYQSALNSLLAAQATFDGLPASIRKRFGNDPAEFVDFMDDPDNLDEAIKLGLANRPSPPPQSEATAPKSDSAPPKEPPAAPEGE